MLQFAVAVRVPVLVAVAVVVELGAAGGVPAVGRTPACTTSITDDNVLYSVLGAGQLSYTIPSVAAYRNV